MTEIKLFRPEPKYYEDVNIGDELPPLTKGPYNVMKAAKFSAMNGDYYPGHYDSQWATQKDRTKGVVAHGLQITTYLSQLLTDWMGPDGFLRRFSSQMRSQTYVGDSITFWGKVTDKRVVDGQYLVDCEVRGVNQDDELIIEGTATVILPVRS